jgi:hypothetical protein
LAHVLAENRTSLALPLPRQCAASGRFDAEKPAIRQKKKADLA